MQFLGILPERDCQPDQRNSIKEILAEGSLSENEFSLREAKNLRGCVKSGTRETRLLGLYISDRNAAPTVIGAFSRPGKYL